MPTHQSTIIVLLSILAACTGDPEETDPVVDDPYDVEIGPYDVDIRWTSYGIPHLLADDYGSLGYGLGYAFARDHLCTLADQIVKVRSERAMYFGPGDDNEHIDSDFGWLGLGVVRQAEEGFLTLGQPMQDAIVGYTAGYNRWLSETGVENLPAQCRDADWVKPITHIDLVTYFLHLGQFGSGYPLVDLIGNAQPPSRRSWNPPPPIERLEYFLRPPMGSNGWAIGSDRTAEGRGMLLSNTHFPSEGERQWHEYHLTVPGQLNLYGVSLVGVPLVNMGFNEHVAWTHTVSNTPRFTAYVVKLQQGDPTRYWFDGGFEDMKATSYTIRVLRDGELVEETRTLYRTHYGPVFNAPVAGWSNAQAFTYRDVNENQLGMPPTWFGMGHAASLEEFKAAQRDHQGIPWVHTMLADDQGNAWYADAAATPNLDEATEERYAQFVEDNFLAATFADFGLIVLDGGDPLNAWVEDAAAARPGAIPFDDCPQHVRSDYVTNSNDNYWFSNPEAPMTGFPLIYGDAPHPLTPRTRMNHLMLEQTGEGSASGADGKFTLDELEAVALSARSSVTEALHAQVVARCSGVEDVTVMVDEAPVVVDISEACDTIAAWDGRFTADAVGAVVWREAIGSGTYSWLDLGDQGALYADAFDPENAIYTPSVLAPPGEESDLILEAVAKAVLTLEAVEIPLDTTLGDAQYRIKDEKRFPTLGGGYREGVMSIASWENGNTTLFPRATRGEVVNGATNLTDDGYPVNAGNSWIMAMEFTDDGPRGRAVMTYSQSEDAASPHFDDQSQVYSEGKLRPILFTEAEILGDPALVTLRLELE